jgi:type VI secretion system protein ImpJ
MQPGRVRLGDHDERPETLLEGNGETLLRLESAIGIEEVPAAVQWHEGMLLAPQHFQVLSQRLERLLHYQVASVFPFCWGVRRLELDDAKLGAGLFRVLALDAIMPDGLVVHFSAEHGSELDLVLTEEADDLRRAPKLVYLTVPRRGGDTSAVPGTLARYRSVDGPVVRDENTGEGELRIPRIEPRLSLSLGDQPPAAYTALPIAEIGFRNEGFAPTPYVAPCLAVPLTSPLGRLCQAVARRLRETAARLAERARAGKGGPDATIVLETHRMIACLVDALPHFEAVLSTGVAHPAQLYYALTMVLGRISSLSPGQVPPALKPYRHENPRAAFEEACVFAIRMLDRVHDTYIEIPFVRERPGFFALSIQPAWLARDLTVGLRIRPDGTKEAVHDWISQARIGSRSELDRLASDRVSGAARSIVAGDDELQLYPSQGMLLVRIKSDPIFIKPGEALCVVGTGDMDERAGPSEIVLYVKVAG